MKLLVYMFITLLNLTLYIYDWLATGFEPYTLGYVFVFILEMWLWFLITKLLTYLNEKN